MSAENRRTPRKQLKKFLTVKDVSTQSELGRLVDISLVGMMLIGSFPLTVHHEYLIDVQMSPENFLRLRATCIWSRSGTTNTAHHGSGFRFEDVTAAHKRMLAQLILAEKPEEAGHSAAQ